MFATLLFASVACGQAQPEKAVTDAEKAEFLKLVAKLPSRGEFFTAEAITKAVPHTRVLLALTEKDLEKQEIYPFLALNRGLIDRKESAQYGIANFDKIAHPKIKLFWASVLFREKSPSPEILAYLRKTLDSKEQTRELSAMLGPGFQEFKEKIILASEAGKQTRVELVKQHTVKALPDFGGGFGYTSEQCILAPGRLLYAVRPLKQQGELITHDLAKGAMHQLPIPQPAGFKAKFEFLSYFDNPVLSLNPIGDIFCCWTLEGNGNHGIGLLKKGSKAFVVTRVDLYLADCVILGDSEGGWYIVEGAPRITIHHVDSNLKLTRLGNFAGKGHHSTNILDARFIAKDVLHLFWGDVLSGGNHLRMRCVDFDVKKQKWLHSREIFRLDKFVSYANRPTVLQLEDDSVHYLWRVSEGAMPGDATGLYYQAESDGKSIKIAGGYDYRAIAAGSRIVVAYTVEKFPEKVFFRVINNGVPGPVSEVAANLGKKHALGCENILLHMEAGRIWLVNTQATNALFELKLVDGKVP